MWTEGPPTAHRCVSIRGRAGSRTSAWTSTHDHDPAAPPRRPAARTAGARPVESEAGGARLGEAPARVSVVIPAKNEARNIAWVLDRLPSIVDEVILVDGNSTDDTIGVSRAARPDIVVLRDEKPGKGSALRAGFAAATGEFMVMIDADGSMDPLEIPSFVARLEEGYDLVRGSRFVKGGGTADISPIRSLGHIALLGTSNVLFSSTWTDLCYGYAAFRRTAVLELGLTATGFEVEAQLFLRSLRNQLRVAEVPSFEAPRRFGDSNLHAIRDGWRVLMTILSERSRPLVRSMPTGAPVPMSVPAGALTPASSSAALSISMLMMPGLEMMSTAPESDLE